MPIQPHLSTPLNCQISLCIMTSFRRETTLCSVVLQSTTSSLQAIDRSTAAWMDKARNFCELYQYLTVRSKLPHEREKRRVLGLLLDSGLCNLNLNPKASYSALNFALWCSFSGVYKREGRITTSMKLAHSIPWRYSEPGCGRPRGFWLLDTVPT